MDRRSFGKSIVAGLAAATSAGIGVAKAASASAALGPGQAWPGLKVMRNPKVRLGGEYRTGEGGTISKENMEYQLRWGIKYLTTSLEGSRATPEVLPNTPRGERGGNGLGGAPEGAPAKGPAEKGRGAGPGVLSGRMTPSEPWDADGLKKVRDTLEKNGLVFEGIRMDSAYIAMKPGPDRTKHLDVVCDNIRKAGDAGVKVISFHWNLTPIRRNTTVPGRGGSRYSAFKLEPDWKMLPLTGAGRVTSDDYWERIDTYLKAVIPAATQAKVKMACHPYDPGGLPLGYLGVDSFDAGDYTAGLLRYEKIVDSPYNGFQYEVGVARESMPVGQDQLDLLHGLLARKKVNQIHFRNVRGGQNDFVEVYHDEGDINMFNVIRLLRDMDWEGSLLPDHSPAHPADPNSLQGFAFANGYIQGLLRAADEEAIRLT